MLPTTHRWVKRALLATLILLLLLPAFQARLHLVELEALGGYVAPEEVVHPDFSWVDLYQATYQPRLEQYLNGRVGFREWFVRLRNQFSYSVLRTPQARDIVIGRDRVLYEKRPIDAYMGSDFIGPAMVRHYVRRFKAVQDTLARRGKLLVFVATPSKASYLPEYLPAHYQAMPRRPTNYAALTAEMRAAGVNLLDLSSLFRQWKDTTRYPLFPRGGIHWSMYGAALAGDTLIGYLNQHYHHVLRDFKVGPGEVSREPRGNDNDVVRALNVLWAPAAYRMNYPVVATQPLQPQQRQPNLLLIGDSFCWMIMYPFISEAFNNQQSRFWYYNHEVAWPDNRPEGTEVWRLDRKQQYLSRDIIVVMFTEYNLANPDSGFSDNAYNLFTPFTAADSAAVRRLEGQLSQRQDLKEYWWNKGRETGKTQVQLIRERAEAAYDSLRD
jgi:hypothetical protein